MNELIAHADQINRQLARYGVKFGIYKNGTFLERLFPFDPIPRVIPADQFAVLEQGLIQRVTALNLFLKDIYGAKQIISDGVVPEDFVYRSPGYLPQCEGFVPPKGIYSHIFGSSLTKQQQDELKATILAQPRRFISQEVIDFQDLPIIEDGTRVEHKADLRAFVLAGETVRVWPSGLTRFSRNPDSFVVNSSQGGGFKDTWIMSH